MTPQRAVFSDAAVDDILEQAAWYESQAGEKLAARWETAVTATVLRIARNPGVGSPCRFHSDELRGIRRLPVTKFPKYLVFYRPEKETVLVLRVLHGARDLESLL